MSDDLPWETVEEAFGLVGSKLSCQSYVVDPDEARELWELKKEDGHREEIIAQIYKSVSEVDAENARLKERIRELESKER